MEFFYLVSAAISLVALIVFFLMAANVGRIKANLQEYFLKSNDNRRNEARLQYYTFKALDRKQEANERLTYMMMYDLMAKDLSDTERRAKYDKLKDKYSGVFDETGGKFPNYPL